MRFAALALAIVVSAVGTEVSAAEPRRAPLALITCPETWPGLDAPGLPVTHALPTSDFQVGGFPDDGYGYDWIGKGPGEVQMDCGYGSDGYKTTRRITVLVPGYPTRCEWHRKAGAKGTLVLGCQTAPGPDGFLGEVRWRMAEQVSLVTTLQGFGLRRTPEEIRATADGRGYAVAAASAEGPPRVFHLTRDGERLEVTFTDGLSSLVIWLAPDGAPASKAFFDQAKLRFGITSTANHSLSRLLTARYLDYWLSTADPVVAGLPKFGNPHPSGVHLVDLSKIER